MYLDEIIMRLKLYNKKKIDLYRCEKLHMEGIATEIDHEITYNIHDGIVTDIEIENDTVKIKAKWFD